MGRWRLKRFLLVVGVVFVVALGLPLALYGSLRPCEMLRQDLRTAFRAAAGRMAAAP